MSTHSAWLRPLFIRAKHQQRTDQHFYPSFFFDPTPYMRLVHRPAVSRTTPPFYKTLPSPSPASFKRAGLVRLHSFYRNGRQHILFQAPSLIIFSGTKTKSERQSRPVTLSRRSCLQTSGTVAFVPVLNNYRREPPTASDNGLVAPAFESLGRALEGPSVASPALARL
ncbi:hypothetical protein CONLIGDRAFT_678635 [Coniochaeta ligniaria NRRL 30616]|uniref:Uncharacterized protein n=1 Tax=Coniochaeta ligniaria NRRL 30616 TaxID=1408157 RepID=A0A1J7JWS1_9PEZI|nr:hypothetical protein CONLIGDRAFT_678635 [Coniochaeta ligniaria NRRL 30616]